MFIQNFGEVLVGAKIDGSLILFVSDAHVGASLDQQASYAD